MLKNQNISASYKRVRLLAIAVGKKCLANRVKVTIKPGENVAGKRVIISIDGGRVRTRKINPKKKPSKGNKGKRDKFDTPWREPKLFVIHVLEEDGSVSKTECPIYDLVIGDDKADECFGLLADYLKELQIEKATEVLVVADGAHWIWNRAKTMLLNLGVKEEKINEAIDYCHAVEKIAEIINAIYPSNSRFWKEYKQKLLKSLKRSLYKGKVHRVIARLKKEANGKKHILKSLNYFIDNLHRMQYSDLRDKHLPCGSGIIESAIRRIITR